MKEKTLNQYLNFSLVVKIGVVALILNLCYPAHVCSKNIVPLSLLGRTTGRVNNHMMDKLVNLYLKGMKWDEGTVRNNIDLKNINHTSFMRSILFIELVFRRRTRRTS